LARAGSTPGHPRSEHAASAPVTSASRMITRTQSNGPECEMQMLMRAGCAAEYKHATLVDLEEGLADRAEFNAIAVEVGCTRVASAAAAAGGPGCARRGECQCQAGCGALIELKLGWGRGRFPSDSGRSAPPAAPGPPRPPSPGNGEAPVATAVP
jgi:hypothetical protein